MQVQSLPAHIGKLHGDFDESRIGHCVTDLRQRLDRRIELVPNNSQVEVFVYSVCSPTSASTPHAPSIQASSPRPISNSSSWSTRSAVIALTE
jgi:hypothetical protein